MSPAFFLPFAGMVSLIEKSQRREHEPIQCHQHWLGQRTPERERLPRWPVILGEQSRCGTSFAFLGCKVLQRRRQCELRPASGLPSKMAFDYQLKSEGSQEMTKLMHSMGRYGHENDMAGLVLFLSSRASAFVTAETICLDGGMAHITGADKLPLGVSAKL
eukprot:TRINITY_DN15868_c0_g1_i2.p2 TRINITY_DN15868_c0_g1~~TRINITY_DN15868_c0_g1_i2.p2  ORF type:complete len:161 (-),score=18.45 TRINITY_DN15868_c0_g1_i2:39-521(-)